MNIKAVFLDIDGTFFDHKTNCVLPESMEAVKLLQRNGYKVALCSGRAKEMALQLGVLQMHSWDGYIGGAGVSVYNEDLEIIHQEYFSHEQASTIFEIGKHYDICINSHGEHEFMTKPLNEYTKEVFDLFHCEIPIVREWHQEPMIALSAYEKKGYDWSIFKHIKGVELLYPSDTLIDFMKVGISKYVGIIKLMEYWGFEPNAYIAFGDSMNDYEMIQHAAIGVVMENGDERLKAIADHLCASSDQPGIYEMLKKLQLL